MANNYAIQILKEHEWVDVEFYHLRAYAIDMHRDYSGKNRAKESRLVYIANGRVIAKHRPKASDLESRQSTDSPEPTAKIYSVGHLNAIASGLGQKRQTLKGRFTREPFVESTWADNDEAVGHWECGDPVDPPSQKSGLVGTRSRVSPDAFFVDTVRVGYFVYAIRCRRNSAFYVGRTGNMFNRIKHHLGKLQRGRHHNSRLQYDWTYFGGKEFYMEILEECETKEDSIQKEAALIREFSRSARTRFYNTSGAM